MNEEQELAKALIEQLDWSPIVLDTIQEGCGQDHLLRILTQIADGEVSGAKAHRFIGWAQGVLCMKGLLSLDSARDLNRNVIENM